MRSLFPSGYFLLWNTSVLCVFKTYRVFWTTEIKNLSEARALWTGCQGTGNRQTIGCPAQDVTGKGRQAQGARTGRPKPAWRGLLARGMSWTLNRRSFSHTDRILLPHISFFSSGPNLEKSSLPFFTENFSSSWKVTSTETDILSNFLKRVSQAAG